MNLSVPVLRRGRVYRSLDTSELADPRTGEPIATVDVVNAGLIRRDLRRASEMAAALRSVRTDRLVDYCVAAAEIFMNDSLPLNDSGDTQSPQEYVEILSITSGLPHVLCRQNMEKVRTVLAQMPTILRGLTRGLDLSVLDRGIGAQDGMDLSYHPTADALGVVLPSNSPGVNSIWLPAIPLKTPVVLKPGREEPWTPLRIIQAMIAAGCPAEALGFYPTDHEGADAIMTGCGRAIIFGDDKTLARYAGKSEIQLHGTGRSKVLIGEDKIDQWERWIDILVDSILANGGRSCINASAILVPRFGDAIAEALAERLAAFEPLPPEDPQARLSAFPNVKFAEYIDAAIEEGLKTPGAREVTAPFRNGERRVELGGYTYLRPTVVRCADMNHPLANTEFLFPFASVVELPQDRMAAAIGPSLAVSAITDDAAFIEALVNSPDIDRLNLGPTPTCRVSWDQPHEGNLFDFLYRRRAIQRAAF